MNYRRALIRQLHAAIDSGERKPSRYDSAKGSKVHMLSVCSDTFDRGGAQDREKVRYSNRAGNVADG
uniref:Uncharacterized protein n=1 Tax=Thermosporothrix sp. COM3 TaxID=2490863 RepID=A0A455SHH8_9CHLR|nr:hypothetical protein KTC_11400 [Thermosporothrix sp. COM3]